MGSYSLSSKRTLPPLNMSYASSDENFSSEKHSKRTRSGKKQPQRERQCFTFPSLNKFQQITRTRRRKILQQNYKRKSKQNTERLSKNCNLFLFHGMKNPNPSSWCSMFRIRWCWKMSKFWKKRRHKFQRNRQHRTELFFLSFFLTLWEKVSHKKKYRKVSSDTIGNLLFNFHQNSFSIQYGHRTFLFSW